MLAILLIGGAGVIFKASSGGEAPATKPIRVKSAESKFDLDTY